MSKVNLELLKTLRKENDYSQEDIAKLLGYKTLYPYQRKEIGKQPFKAEEIHLLANFYQKPLEYFFVQDFA